jgi:hypothetical protein
MTVKTPYTHTTNLINIDILPRKEYNHTLIELDNAGADRAILDVNTYATHRKWLCQPLNVTLEIENVKCHPSRWK